MTAATELFATQFTEQASVTNWPLRLALVGVMLAIVALVLWGMYRGWRSRQQRQSDLPAPHSLDEDPSLDEASDADSAAATGLYLGTSTAGDWLDRIAVHGLGVRSRAEMSLSPRGVVVRRDGAPSFLIPARDIRGVRTDRGVAGTVRAKDSVIVVTWQLGGALVDTGFRADDGVDHHTLLDGLMSGYPAPADGGVT